MGDFAYYRLPHTQYATCVTQTDGDAEELTSCVELNRRSGFVFAPFQTGVGQPLLLIRADRVETVSILELTATEDLSQTLSPEALSTADARSRLYYSIDFANYHSQLEAGTFRKIVLARCVDEPVDGTQSPLDLFYRACRLYPRMFVALVSTRRAGCWLTATPEILLEGKDAQWRTIALAGTMRREPDRWSSKNMQEQRIVATYLAECLEQFTGDFREEGPYTVRAAALFHLRSDFTFTLPDTQHIGDLLHALHPTPAVGGLPKREACQFIVSNEHTPRRYYSGFMGMLDPERETHLYVSLRCMNIESDCYHLYAGGGLLKDSTEEQEWQETEAKLETMRSLLKR